jgi:NAD(P)-dependent dehydrogenase (short-subunit alcohol dehydrogenase family)
MITDVLGYAGKRVVVTGAASGMGAATAQRLVELDAEVIGLDVQPIEAPTKSKLKLDLRDKTSIDAAVRAIGRPVDAIFSVAGVPGPPFSNVDTLLVNFVGARQLIESLVPVMPAGSAIACVASVAGIGWQQDLPNLMPLLQTQGFDAGKAWLEANPKAIESNYLFSKKMINAWVAWRGATLLRDAGIRLNCTNPGPTETGMMPAFEALYGKALVDSMLGPARRRSSSDEQAWPLIFLNSTRSSYIAGAAVQTDAGFLGAVTTGALNAKLPSEVDIAALQR